MAFGYFVGQCQDQTFSGFNNSGESALCHRILIFGLKVVIFDECRAVESLADINELINAVSDIFLVTDTGFFEYLFLNSQFG